MATLTIEGKRVTVGDEFLSLPPEQQDATVEEIARELKLGAAKADEPSAPKGDDKPKKTFSDVFWNETWIGKLLTDAGEFAKTPGDVLAGKVAVRDADGNISEDLIRRSANGAMLVPMRGAPSVTQGSLGIPRAEQQSMTAKVFGTGEAPKPTAPAPVEIAMGADGVARPPVAPTGSMVPQEEIVGAAGRLDMAVPKVMATDSMPAQWAGGVAMNVPGAGIPLRKAVQGTVDEAGARLDEIASTMGGRTAEGAGDVASSGITDWIGNRSKKALRAAYDAVDEHIDDAVRAPLAETTKKAEEIAARYENAGLATETFSEIPFPTTSPRSAAPAVETVRAGVKPDVAGDSLGAFIAKNGGLELTDDLAHLGIDKMRVPYGGNVARKGGKPLDGYWRNKLADEGFIARDADGTISRDVRGELYEMLRREAAGDKVYRQGVQTTRRQASRTADENAAQAGAVQAARDDVLRELEAAGIPAKGATPAVVDDIAERLVRGEDVDVLAAYERGVMAAPEPRPSAAPAGATKVSAIPDGRDKTSKAVAEIANALGKPLDYKGAKFLRTHIGEMLEKAPDGVSKGELKELYGALTRDLEGIIGASDKSGRAKLLWKRANQLNIATESRREALAKIVGAKHDAPPAAVLDRLVKMASDSSRQNSASLALARKTVGKEWDEVVSAVVAKLGRSARDGADVFSMDKFVTDWAKLSKEGKALLFDGPHRQALDDLATIMTGGKQRLGKFSNPSGSGHTLMGGAMGGGLLVEPMTVLTSILPAATVSVALSRPATAKAVRDFVKVAAESPSPARVNRAARELAERLTAAGIAANDNATFGVLKAASDEQKEKQKGGQR